MTAVSDQAYLHTRVSAMSGRLLDTAALKRLSELSLPALAERFGLGAMLDEQTPPRTRSRAVEQGLIQTLLAELQILIRPMLSPERALLLAWGRKYALYNLKALIRGKLYELDPKEIREQLFDLPEHIRLPHQDLFRAENVLELLRKLEVGPNRLIARQAREAYEQQRDPFALEAAIDQRYYAGLLRQVLELQERHRDSLRCLLGAELDRIDLLWLLRFRFSYQLSPSETFYQLIPSPRLLTRERLLTLVNLEGSERVLAALPPPLDQLMGGCTDILDAQRRIGAYALREWRAILQHSPSAVARALAYLMLRETDLRRLFAIVQGQLLDLPGRAIEDALDLGEPGCDWSSARAA